MRKMFCVEILAHIISTQNTIEVEGNVATLYKRGIVVIMTLE
jgi:hypothetical protein